MSDTFLPKGGRVIGINAAGAVKSKKWTGPISLSSLIWKASPTLMSGDKILCRPRNRQAWVVVSKDVKGFWRFTEYHHHDKEAALLLAEMHT